VWGFTRNSSPLEKGEPYAIAAPGNRSAVGADPNNPRANQRHPGFGLGVEGRRVETVLAKSDLELGLEFFLGKPKP
jgi:hypothetical protein